MSKSLGHHRADMKWSSVYALANALHSVGYRPLVPIRAAQFKDTAQRETWIREKGMQVLQGAQTWGMNVSRMHKPPGSAIVRPPLTDPFDQIV